MGSLDNPALFSASLRDSGSQLNPVPVKCALSSFSLEECVASFGMSLKDIAPGQIGYFLAARSFGPLVRRLGMPAAGSDDGEACTVQESLGEGVCGSQQGDPTGEPERFPAPSFTVGPAKISELRHILPHQFSYPQDRLLYLLGNGKLTRRIMLKPHEEPIFEQGETPKPRDSLQKGSAQNETQRAYILLDVSQSMNGEVPLGARHPDKRGMVARGLALAFLQDAKTRYAQLHLRPFSSTVGVRESAFSSSELQAFARKILQLRNDGRTALQQTLEAAEADLAGMGRAERIDVMLISDGLSLVKSKPFQDTFLHTFLIGDSCAPAEEGQSGTYEKLQQWSETFRHISSRNFAEVLCPTAEDLAFFERLAQESTEQAIVARDREELGELRNNLELAQAIADLAIEFGGNEKKKAAALRSRAMEGLTLVAAPEVEAEALARESEYEVRCALYDAHLPSKFRGAASRAGELKGASEDKDASVSLAGGGGSQGSGFLLQLAQAMINRVRALIHSFRPRL